MNKWADSVTRQQSQKWNIRRQETAKYSKKSNWKQPSSCRRCSLFSPELESGKCNRCRENISLLSEYKSKEHTYEGPKYLDEPLFDASWIREKIFEINPVENGWKGYLSHFSGVPVRMLATLLSGKQKYITLSVGDRILVGLGLLGPPPEEAWAGTTMREVIDKINRENGKKRKETRQLSFL